MPRRAHPCPHCQKPCRGAQCRSCGIKRDNGLVRISINPQPQTPQRGSWWAEKNAVPVGFTKLATEMVVPQADKGPVWKWREQES
jgi:hypothetical protein